MGLGGDGRQVFDPPQYVRILHDDAASLSINRSKQPGAVGVGSQFGLRGIKSIAGKLRHRLANADIMRVETRRQHRLFALGNTPCHADRLPARSRAVVHRSIGHIAAKQSRHLRLELKQHLKRALRNFGLIGRVSGQKLAALDQVVHRRRNMMLIRAATEEKWMMRRSHILAGKVREMPFDRHFARMIG